ncbi:MAG: type II toxin-antitoxin system HicA family toxin [Xenococcaceae cyanobacterium MO_188.B29]|nr:type II toxin-antitoxin system HicA family toxin [Xenococcaceae cyanobacterium MO_188.B29]
MSNLPTVKAKEFIKVITKLGYQFQRQKGSHAIYKNLMGRRVTVFLGRQVSEKFLSNEISIREADFKNNY